jgi:hypothetical protein
MSPIPPQIDVTAGVSGSGVWRQADHYIEQHRSHNCASGPAVQLRRDNVASFDKLPILPARRGHGTLAQTPVFLTFPVS